MKKIFNFVFKNSWAQFGVIQAMFFGGLTLASSLDKEQTLIQLLIGFLWFGLTVLWMLGKHNKWFKKE